MEQLARGLNKRRRGADPEEQSAQRRALAAVLGKALLSLALAGAVLCGGVALYRWLTGGEMFRVAQVRIAGNHRATEAELSKLLPIRTGDNLWAADVEAAGRALAKHPWVKDAAVRRDPPDALVVEVTEREPKALVELGGLYLVDRDAQVFKRGQPGDGLDLPVVTGLTRDDYVQRRKECEALIAGALRLLDDVAARGLGRSQAVSEVHVDLEAGLTLTFEGGLQARLGVGDLAAKLDRLERVLSELSKRGAKAEVIHLDNRTHPSWVTVRPVAVAEAKTATGKAQTRVRAQ